MEALEKKKCIKNHKNSQLQQLGLTSQMEYVRASAQLVVGKILGQFYKTFIIPKSDRNIRSNRVPEEYNNCYSIYRKHMVLET